MAKVKQCPTCQGQRVMYGMASEQNICPTCQGLGTIPVYEQKTEKKKDLKKVLDAIDRLKEREKRGNKSDQPR